MAVGEGAVLERRRSGDRRSLTDRRGQASRRRLLLLFTVAYFSVFGCIFGWFYQFSTMTAIRQLRDDLRAVAAGTVQGIDSSELIGLYRDGARDDKGFSQDPRYLRELAWFQTVHRLNPHAWLYTFVRGNQPDTRRIGDAAGKDEFVYLVDLSSAFEVARAAHFLEPDKGSEWSLKAWNEGALVERPGVYSDRFGSWMTDYVPVLDKGGKVCALLGIDFDASYVDEVQQRVKREFGLIFIGAYVLLTAIGFYVNRVRFLRNMFGRYVSLSLLRDRALLQLGYASRRRVTVLFTDINNFSTQCEKRTADEVIAMLNQYFEPMNEIIVSGGGWIKQFVGDEIMVIYGAPDDHPKPEQAALRAALQMIAKLNEMKAAATEPGFFEIKAGIHTGDVIVGNVGSRHRTEYAAVGDHVNLGSRIMNMSKALNAAILISGTTYVEVKDMEGVEFIDRGFHPVKGRLEQVQIYEARAKD